MSNVISVEFIADIVDLVSGVQSAVESVASVAESASGIAELSGAFTEAATAAGELSSQVAGVAGAAGSIAEVGASASELDSELANVGASASEAATGLADISNASGSVADVSASVADLDTQLQGVSGAATEAAASVESSMSGAAASAEEAATATGEAGASGMDGFMGGMSKAGMALMGVQMGLNLVQGAVQQATGPFGNFQEQMTSLVTGAGESESALAGVSTGIEQMSVATGTSTDQLSAGMYLVESAGYHGAQGLQVLQAAAEGAKVGSADLATVANAVTSEMNAYGQGADKAAADTNQLIATVAAGKMHMQDLAGALAAVLPVAAAAHISFAQVGGAIATMTAMGMSAQNASQNLANAIRSLQSPNAQAITEMQAMGLNANQVSMQLGQKGLTGTLQEISQAILNHMGPSGLVLQSALKNSATAAQDAQIEIQAMPKSLQAVAEAYLHGQVSSKEWSAAMKNLDPITQHMMAQFKTTANHTEQFNQLLTKGGPAAQTYTAALSKITGGATGMNVALMLTGVHMSTFESNVNSIAAAAQHGGNSITGWNLVQKDFNQQMAVASAKANVFWIGIGQQLAPAVLGLMGALSAVGGAMSNFASWLSQSSPGAIALKILLIALAGAGIGALLTMVPAMIAGLSGMAVAAWTAAAGFIALNWPIMLIVAALALLVVGVILVVQHWSQIVAFLRGLWQSFASWFMGFWSGFVGWLSGIIASIGAFFVSAWAKIVSGAQTAWNMLVTIVKIALIVLLAIVFAPIVAIAALFIWLYQHNTYFQKLVDAIRGFIQAGVDWLRSTWTDILNWIVAKWTWLHDMATMYFMALYVIIQTAIARAQQFIMSVWTNVVSFLAGVWSKIVSGVSDMWAKVGAFFSSAWSTYVSTPLTNLWNSITNFISGWPSQAVQWGVNLIKSFVSGILSQIGNVTGAVGQIMGKVGGFLGFHSPSKEGPGRELDIWGPNLVRGFVAGLDNNVPLVEAAVTHLMQPVAALGTAPTSAVTGKGQGQSSNGGNGEVHVHNQIILNGQELTNQLMMHAVSEIRRTGPVSKAA